MRSRKSLYSNLRPIILQITLHVVAHDLIEKSENNPIQVVKAGNISIVNDDALFSRILEFLNGFNQSDNVFPGDING